MIDTYQEILHRCYRCGNCKAPQHDPGFLCPAYNRVRMESYAPGARLWLLRGLLNGDLEMTASLSAIFYSCTMCMNCSLSCSFEFAPSLVEIMVSANQCAVTADPPVLPQPVQRYFENVYSHGNPWKKPPKKRGDWARDSEVPVFNGQTHEYLLYVGDICSYMPRTIEIARSVSRLLGMAQISFGILGKAETCNGNDVRNMGEQELFEYLAQKNIARFHRENVKKIITLSPHAYNVFKNEYPKLNGQFEVFHYTSVLDTILQDGRLKLFTPLKKIITYHDPCFLGKWNREYDAPRRILRRIPGISYKEMENIKEKSFCCGGGGGNVFTDILGGGENAPAALRLKAAARTNADILAVACPACLTMFETALEGSGAGLNILDISEIVVLGI